MSRDKMLDWFQTNLVPHDMIVIHHRVHVLDMNGYLDTMTGGRMKKIYTSEEDARKMGATHWAEFSGFAVLLQKVEEDYCSACERSRVCWQPINQDGGPGPICEACIGHSPRELPTDLPTHVSE